MESKNSNNPMIVKGGNISPIKTNKPWGSEELIGTTPYFSLKQMTLRPNQSISLQLHILKREMYHILSGSGWLELGFGQIVHELSAGDAVYLPAGVAHRLVAGSEGIVVAEVATSETTDVIRLGFAHGRQENPEFSFSRYLAVIAPNAVHRPEVLVLSQPEYLLN